MKCAGLRTLEINRVGLIFGLAMVNAIASIAAAQSIVSELTVSKSAVEDRSVIEAMFLAKPTPTAFEELLRRVRIAGGSVLFKDAQLGYVDANIPLEEYTALQSSEVVQEASMDVTPHDPITADLYEPEHRPPPSAVDTPLQRSHIDVDSIKPGASELAVTFIGGNRFLADHPTFDGRGTGVAVVEGLGEFGVPGVFTSRIIGVNAGAKGSPDPKKDRSRLFVRGESLPPDIRRVNTDARGYFSAFGRTFCAPSVGVYLVANEGLEHKYLSSTDNDYVAIMWRINGKQAWIDADGTGDFRKTNPIGDFNETGDIVYLPRMAVAPTHSREDYAIARENEPLGVAVLFDSESGVPQIYAGHSDHATMTGAYAAGGRIGSGFVSAAPSAKLIYVTENNSFFNRVSDTLEGVIRAEQNELISVISISGPLEMLDSSDQSFAANVIERATSVYHKQVFVGGTNFFSLSETVSGVAASPSVVAVGAYVNAAMLKSLAGYSVPRTDYIQEYSRGPSKQGEMKPDLLAPSFGISFGPCNRAGFTPAQALPPCFQPSVGTSAATPMAAGAAAALISGAKQMRIPYGPERVAWSMKAGARFLSDWPAHAQGAGLLRIPESWNLLVQSAVLPDWRTTPDIEITAPLNNRWMSPVVENRSGNGLYEREGWRSGQIGVREITLLRRSGPAGVVTYPIDIQGNDGTYTLMGDSQVALPLNQLVKLSIRVSPESPGIHSANLRLLDSKMRWPVKWVSLVVVAAYQLTAKNSFTATAVGGREFLVTSNRFFNVPEQTKVLHMDITSSGGSGVTPYIQPSLYLASVTKSNTDYSAFWFNTNFTKHPIASRLYPKPPYGVWECSIADTFSTVYFKPEKVAENQSSVTFTALSADVSATVEGAMSGIVLIHASAVNRMGALRGATVVSEVGTMQESRVDEPTVKGKPFVSQFMVLYGAKTLRINVEPLNHKTLLRTFLYYCKSGQQENCKLWDVPLEATTQYTIRRPEYGTWRLVVQPFESDQTVVPYQVSVLQTNDTYGRVTSAQAISPRHSGETWQTDLDVEVNRDVVPKSAKLVALVEVRDVVSEIAEQESIEGGGDMTQRPIAIGSTLVEIPSRDSLSTKPTP